MGIDIETDYYYVYPGTLVFGRLWLEGFVEASANVKAEVGNMFLVCVFVRMFCTKNVLHKPTRR